MVLQIATHFVLSSISNMIPFTSNAWRPHIPLDIFGAPPSSSMRSQPTMVPWLKGFPNQNHWIRRHKKLRGTSPILYNIHDTRRQKCFGSRHIFETRFAMTTFLFLCDIIIHWTAQHTTMEKRSVGNLKCFVIRFPQQSLPQRARGVFNKARASKTQMQHSCVRNRAFALT